MTDWNNKEEVREYMRTYRKDNKEKFKRDEKSIAAQERWRKENPDRWELLRCVSSWRQRGINILTMLRRKPKQCEVCGNEGNLHCDHNHSTGKFRGWLCFKCNCRLGYLETKPELNEKLLQYLAREEANNSDIQLTREEFNSLHW